MASTQKAKIPVGFVIASKYRVTGELGRGGMAAVYEAENVDIGKRVAIKVLAQELTSSTIVVERFLREARAVAAIRSPFICDVYDSGRLDDGRPFLVLELLEGESLYERMVRVGQIDLETTVGVMAQACRGLVKAHAAGIVHRDLKPENIFVTKDEEGRTLAKILDFGLAKFYQPVEEGAEQARLTRDGAVFGTPAYMSPEQVRGQGAVDARADLWALGCITYECVTGRTVWSTDQGVAMTFAQIAQGNVPDPLTFRPDLPESFRAWFKRSLDKDINNRFQGPKEFADELMAATDFSPGGAASRGSEASQDIFFLTRPGSEAAILPNSQRNSNAQETAAAVAPKLPPPPQSSQPSRLSTQQAAPSGGTGRSLLLVGLLGALTAGGYFAYRTYNPSPPAAASNSADPNASASTSAAAMAPTASVSALAHDTGLPFRPLVAGAQAMLAKGDFEGARGKLKEAVDLGAHYMPQTLLQHLDTVKAGTKHEPLCKLTGLGRPRSYDLMEEKVKAIAASRPTIAVSAAGTVMVWTEMADGNEHTYAVALDEALRAKTKPFDVTPEAQLVQRPEIYASGDRFLLIYWDTRGEPGVYARYLDKDGRIDSSATKIAMAAGGAASPTVSLMPDQKMLFTWTEPTDKNTEDFYARIFSPSFEPAGDKVRLTAFKPSPVGRARVRFPVGAIDGDSLRLAYRMERDPDRVVQHIRVPFTALTEGGVKSDGMTSNTPDRIAGALEVVSPAKMRADNPSMSCSPNDCFIVWHEENRDGVWAAPVPIGTPVPLYKREVVNNLGRNPTVAVDSKAQFQVFWFERSKLMTSRLDRDGVREPSVVGRMTTADRPEPSVSPGLVPGQWFVAWSDFEGGHPEAFVARVDCK